MGRVGAAWVVAVAAVVVLGGASCHHAPLVCRVPAPAKSQPAQEPVQTPGTSSSCRTTDGQAGCEPDPKGKGSGQGNTQEYSVCIPSKPTNNDATCAPYRAQFEDAAGMAALKICIQTHGVVCRSAGCKDTCVNTATIDDSRGMYLNKTSGWCKEGEDACVLSFTAWSCTCDCQVQL